MLIFVFDLNEIYFWIQIGKNLDNLERININMKIQLQQ